MDFLKLENHVLVKKNFNKGCCYDKIGVIKNSFPYEDLDIGTFEKYFQEMNGDYTFEQLLEKTMPCQTQL